MAMLEHSDRVCEINLRVLSSSLLENVMGAMQEPFPILTSLRLCFAGKMASAVPVDPDSILDGSAPSLRSLTLEGVPFPALPALLLTATHLVDITLSNIPHSGYFSPIQIVTCLSDLTSLEKLLIGFESPRSCPERDSRFSLPRERTLLPVLTSFSFKGACKYLDDFVARIDAPRLNDLDITLFNQLTFSTLQLAYFIGRTPTFEECDKACVEFYDSCVSVTLSRTNSHRLRLRALSRPSDWQLGSLTQVCTSSFPDGLIPKVERLYIFDGSSELHWQDDMDKDQWLELLQPFVGVKDLYLSWKIVPQIAPALKELVGDRVTKVLPALKNLFLEGLNPSGPVEEALKKFTDARELIELRVDVSHWYRTRHVVGGR